MTKITHIATMCHEANYVWCHLNGDPSQLHWGSAPQWQVDSAIDGVKHALAHPDAKPEDSHMNWMAGKIADGWVYGEVKDPVAKTHPCMVPFDQLPEWQQKKDKLFLAIVRALA
jgi:putative SOS response-associated peptidase YedK